MVKNCSILDRYKPRERLIADGVKSLSDDDLLAIILGKGTVNENVFDLSKRLFRGFNKDNFMSCLRVEDLKNSCNIGTVQACQIIATLELGKRLYSNDYAGKRIQSSAEAYEIVKNMQYLHKEHLRGLYINSRHKLIHDEVISIGSLDANIIHPREVFRPAVEYGAFAIILAHNHPSGDETPSAADLEVTEKLKKIGDLIQIPLIDHLVIGDRKYSSICQPTVIQ
ncbi:DNA repair protein RadC [Candidatus Gracilibacteria bacterium]|nr:DNA repair protein RadC [Candidatus Gracilibacteria bacterium]